MQKNAVRSGPTFATQSADQQTPAPPPRFLQHTTGNKPLTNIQFHRIINIPIQGQTASGARSSSSRIRGRALPTDTVISTGTCQKVFPQTGSALFSHMPSPHIVHVHRNKGKGLCHVQKSVQVDFTLSRGELEKSRVQGQLSSATT